MANIDRIPGSKYGPEDRKRAVAAYLIQGTIRKAAKAEGMPENTLYDWARSDG